MGTGIFINIYPIYSSIYILERYGNIYVYSIFILSPLVSIDLICILICYL